MKRPLAPLGVRPLLLAILVGILSLSVLYSASVRTALLVPDLQFIPVEDEFILVTGDLESLWEGLDHHFGPVFLDEAEEVGALTKGFRSLRDTFSEEGSRVERLSDLVSHGLAIERGLLMSTHRSGGSEPSVLVALPAADRTRLTEFVSALMDQEPDEEPPALGLPGAELVSFGARSTSSGSTDPPVSTEADASQRNVIADLILAYPGDRRALLAANPDHLRRSLLYRERNLAHASADDELYRVVRERLQGSLGSGPAVFGWWRPLTQPGVEQVTAIATLRPDAVRVGLEVKVDAGILRVLDDFLIPTRMSEDWGRYLGTKTAAALVIEDEALSDHMGFVRRFAAIRNFMDNGFGGVLSEVEDLPGLHRILLAVTGYRDGLPELLMGVWADPDSLNSLVRDVQLDRRKDRDRAVLEGALDAWLSGGGATLDELVTAGVVPLEALEQAGLLAPEEGGTFHRYRIRAGEGDSESGLRVEAANLVEEDLDSGSYVRFHGSYTVRLVFPPITDNDISYVEGLAEADGEALRSDRYRLATVVQDSVLWVATDVLDVGELIDGATGSSGGSLEENEAFKVARTMWRRGDRIQGFLDIERLTTLGLLSPESKVQEMVKLLLLDFRNHSSVSFAVRPEETREHLMIDAAAFLYQGRRNP